MRRIKIPLGLPVIFAGIRTAAVQIVSAATLAAFIGGGGLGELIFTGIALNEFGTAAALPDAGCTRKNQWGVFITHPTTTFVVQMNGTDSNVYVSQGPPPREWLVRGDETLAGKIHWDEPRKGLILSAGTGYMWFLHTVGRSCGNLTDCERTNFPGGFTAAADFWFTSHFAAHTAVLRPVDQIIEGGGTGFTFDSRQQTRVVIIGGKAGVRAGAARIYGTAGFNHYESTFTTHETVNDQTLTVDGVATVLKGTSQTVGAKTSGWNWVFGGGVEAWFSKWLGIYMELERAKLKGEQAASVEGAVTDQLTTILGGVRVRLGR